MNLKTGKFHFVGIGGIGMCGLAELLHNIGAEVSGSDLSENVNTEHLKKIGVKVFKGHARENVGAVDVLVYSSAISFNNPEMLEARARQIPLIPRAEALAEIMRLKRGVAIAGTHGKTTTTSMASAIFLNAGAQPTILVGGRLDLIKSTALLGEGEWMLAEADESDGSFLKLSPEIAIITNVDSDHLDYYKSFENLKAAYLQFALKIPFYGCAIVCGDDLAIKEIFEKFPKRVVTYGFNVENDFVLRGENGHYELLEGKTGSEVPQLLGAFEVGVPGRHNALNATASLIAGLTAGFAFDVCKQGLIQFRGVDRRFQFKGKVGGVEIYDDYGHHPTEVRATLQGFREKFPDRRLVVFFQPHRYSRTEICWNDFLGCFSNCDRLMIGDIYAAGESSLPGITSERLAHEIKHDHVSYLPQQTFEEMAKKVAAELSERDIFVTLGAGDGYKLGLALLQR